MFRTSADVPNHRQTGVNTYTDSEANAFIPLQTGMQGLHGFEHSQSGTDGSLCLILIGLWIAEIDQQAITEVLRNVAIKLMNHLRAGGLVGPEYVSVVFWIELPESCVESTTSANITVSWRRSASGVPGAGDGGLTCVAGAISGRAGWGARARRFCPQALQN